MDPIGEQLRAARKAQNLTLRDLAERTKIRISLLEALESESYEEFPDAFRTLSFQRQYATELGMDGDAAVEAIRSVVSDTSRASDRDRVALPEVPTVSVLESAKGLASQLLRDRIGPLTTVAVAVVLIVFGLVWWSSLNTVGSGGDRPDPAAEASPPQSSAASTPGSAEAPPRLKPRLNVEIQALGLLWLRYLADGENGREVTLSAGERLSIRGESVIQMSVGDAARTVLVFDGQRHEGLGESGSVRHIRITREGWSFVPSGTF